MALIILLLIGKNSICNSGNNLLVKNSDNITLFENVSMP